MTVSFVTTRPARSLATDTPPTIGPMSRLWDKAIVYLCCLAAASRYGRGVGAVVCALAAATLACLTEAARPSLVRPEHLRAAVACAAACAGIAFPQALPYCPLAAYELATAWPVRQDREVAGPTCVACVASGALLAIALVTRATFEPHALDVTALLALFCATATLLALRTTHSEREHADNLRVRDDLQGRSLRLAAANRDLASRREYEVEVATLAERARIAREIHDNVGHLLTRARLQAEALRVVHADEPGVAADFADVSRTVDEALDMVRTSVHVLRDDSIDLGVQLRQAANDVTANTSATVAVEVCCESADANVSACLVAVAREAMSNALRHGHARTIELRCVEHPSLYQLVVLDDGGTCGTGDCGKGASGMGLASMRERVEGLGGSFAAGPRPDACGWRVFASVPKRNARTQRKVSDA